MLKFNNMSDKESQRWERKIAKRTEIERQRRVEMAAAQWPPGWDPGWRIIQDEISAISITLYGDINRQYNDQFNNGSPVVEDIANRIGSEAVYSICDALMRRDRYVIFNIREEFVPQIDLPAVTAVNDSQTYSVVEMKYNCGWILYRLNDLSDGSDFMFGSIVATFRDAAIKRMIEFIRSKNIVNDMKLSTAKNASSSTRPKESSDTVLTYEKMKDAIFNSFGLVNEDVKLYNYSRNGSKDDEKIQWKTEPSGYTVEVKSIKNKSAELITPKKRAIDL